MAVKGSIAVYRRWQSGRRLRRVAQGLPAHSRRTCWAPSDCMLTIRRRYEGHLISLPQPKIALSHNVSVMSRSDKLFVYVVIVGFVVAALRLIKYISLTHL